MGEGEAGISGAEQGILVWAILCVFVSFLGAMRNPCKRCIVSMKWLLKAFETATSPKVDCCVRLSWGPYREAILKFPDNSFVTVCNFS